MYSVEAAYRTFKQQLLSGLQCAPRTGRLAGHLLEGPAENGFVAETDFNRHAAQADVRPRQQTLGLFDAAVKDVLHRRNAQRGAEAAREVALAHGDVTRHVVGCDAGAAMLFDIPLRRLHACVPVFVMAVPDADIGQLARRIRIPRELQRRLLAMETFHEMGAGIDGGRDAGGCDQAAIHDQWRLRREPHCRMRCGDRTPVGQVARRIAPIEQPARSQQTHAAGRGKDAAARLVMPHDPAQQGRGRGHVAIKGWQHQHIGQARIAQAAFRHKRGARERTHWLQGRPNQRHIEHRRRLQIGLPRVQRTRDGKQLADQHDAARPAIVVDVETRRDGGKSMLHGE